MKELRASFNFCGYLNGGLLLGYSRFLVFKCRGQECAQLFFLHLYFHGVMQGAYLPIAVAALFKAWVCGRSLAGILGSNPAGGMNVCLLFCVVRLRSVRRADHSSRGVLPNV